MKKIFSILAAAIIALSFASCEKTDPGMKFFKLKVTNITDSSAVFTVTPADTTVYYGLSLLPTRILEEYTLDTLLASNLGELQWYIDYYGIGLEELLGVALFQGPFSQEVTELPANYAFTFMAYEVQMSEDSVLSIGRVATKNFRTKGIEVVGTKNLGVLEHSYFEDYRDFDGSFYVEGWNVDEAGENLTALVGMCIFDEDLVGTFTFEDFDSDENYSFVLDLDEEKYFALADAKVKGTVNGEAAKLEGWVVGTNGIKYNFSVEYAPVEEDPAPARRIVNVNKKEVAKAHKGLEKQPLTLKKFHK